MSRCDISPSAISRHIWSESKPGRMLGGHSASSKTLRRIYDASLRNLRRAADELDVVWVYDNTNLDASHPLVLEARSGELQFLVDDPSSWLKTALGLS